MWEKKNKTKQKNKNKQKQKQKQTNKQKKEKPNLINGLGWRIKKIIWVISFFLSIFFPIFIQMNTFQTLKLKHLLLCHF